MNATNKQSNKRFYKDSKKQKYLKNKKDVDNKYNENFRIGDNEYAPELIGSKLNCENNSDAIYDGPFNIDKIIRMLHHEAELSNTFFCECCLPHVVTKRLKKYGCNNIEYDGCGKCYCCLREW